MSFICLLSTYMFTVGILGKCLLMSFAHFYIEFLVFLSNYELFINSGYKFFIRFANILPHSVNFLFFFPLDDVLWSSEVFYFSWPPVYQFFFFFISSEPTAFPICSAVNYVAFIRKFVTHSFSLFCLLFQLFYCLRCYLHLIYFILFYF